MPRSPSTRWGEPSGDPAPFLFSRATERVPRPVTSFSLVYNESTVNQVVLRLESILPEDVLIRVIGSMYCTPKSSPLVVTAIASGTEVVVPALITDERLVMV